MDQIDYDPIFLSAICYDDANRIYATCIKTSIYHDNNINKYNNNKKTK